ncbi:uncharacterized protein LOC128274587 [Anopheles cruzii]|uniref:uncharacterized protein LOC128274587 n=1 Tax=Anopheles cruzii TaxID=68878 RepID=UPI0022EC63D2|nr:uncharacterized protein LOC128274587 [Anopheles cruzii]
MKAQTAILLLVASSFCVGSPIPRPNATKPQREIPQEVLDLIYESFITVFRTVETTYPPELLEQLAKELLTNGGRFTFSEELSATLEAKTVEVKHNLKYALEEFAFAVAGIDPTDEVTVGKVHDYLDYSVEVLVNSIPWDVVEKLVVEVLENEGSFEFTPELEALLAEALVNAKLELRQIVDYEFEVFEDLLDLDEEMRALIYQAIDYLAEETYQAIPWKLLEDIVYEVIENDGVIDLSDALNDRMEDTLEVLRQKLIEVLDSMEALLFPTSLARVVSDEVMQLVYESILTVFNSLVDNFPDDVFQDVVHAVLIADGRFDFSPELTERFEVALQTVRSAMQKDLVALAAGFEGADEDTVARFEDYFEHAIEVTFSVFPYDVLEEITKEVLANGGVFEFSDVLWAMIDADLVRIKEGMRELFAYEFEVFPELQGLTEEEILLINQASDFAIDEVYKIIPWGLFEEIVYSIVSNDGLVDFSSDLLERIDNTMDQMAIELKEIMDRVTDMWE